MRILIAEDENVVARNIANSLQVLGFNTEIVSRGEDVWFKGSTENYSAIILDLGLPQLDGISILKKWRDEGVNTPVIVVSARGSWSERVDGIDSGADDYLPKPFQVQELVSRLNALIRRRNGLAQSSITAGPLEIDMRARVIKVAGEILNITPLEFRLVHFLLLKNGEVVGKVELSEAIYDHSHERDVNAVEAVVSRLRKKLGLNIIQSKRGFGYFISPGNSCMQDR